MLEQLKARLAAATYPDNDHKQRCAGLVQQCSDQLAAVGANLVTADGFAASDMSGAISAALAAVNAQTFPSNMQKEQAKGALNMLRDRLASLGLT